MVFQNKAALWLLLAIPVLILIYLIRSQHEDYPVSSTYIWKLSAKYSKRKLPVQKLRRMLLFLTQLLLITAVSLAVAGPSIPNGDSCNYILILDCSASMNTKDSLGSTRFERAVKKALEYTDKLKEGHTLSLITAADTAAIALRDSGSANEFKHALEDASCGMGAFSLPEAVTLAETLAASSGLSSVVVITDSDYDTTPGTSVINVNSGEWNVYVDDIRVNTASSAGVRFTGRLGCEGRTETVTVGLKIDGEVKDEIEVKCTAGESTELVFTQKSLGKFSTAEIYVLADDGFPYDNSSCICRTTAENVKVLLVSDQPLYLKSCLSVLNNVILTVAGTEEAPSLSGYNLYVLDGFTPRQMPTDGSVLIFNDEQNGLVNAGERIEKESVVSGTNETKLPAKIAGLIENITASSMYVSAYSPLSAAAASGWMDLLFCGSNCIMTARASQTGLLQLVAGFDLHNSNLPMLADFIYLMRNIVNASLPSIIDDNDYTLGESIDFILLPSADEFYLEEPSGSVVKLDSSERLISYTPTQVGLHTVIETNAVWGSYADFFVHLLPEESKTAEEGSISVNLSGFTSDESGKPVAVPGSDATPALTPLWFYFVLAALVLLIIEWEVYYYEQY